MKRDLEFAYIGKKKCGCVVAVCIDTGESWVMDEIRNMGELGCTIERVTIEESRNLLQVCIHKVRK